MLAFALVRSRDFSPPASRPRRRSAPAEPAGALAGGRCEPSAAAARRAGSRVPRTGLIARALQHRQPRVARIRGVLARAPAQRERRAARVAHQLLVRARVAQARARRSVIARGCSVGHRRSLGAVNGRGAPRAAPCDNRCPYNYEYLLPTTRISAAPTSAACRSRGRWPASRW